MARERENGLLHDDVLINAFVRFGARDVVNASSPPRSFQLRYYFFFFAFEAFFAAAFLGSFSHTPKAAPVVRVDPVSRLHSRGLSFNKACRLVHPLSYRCRRELRSAVSRPEPQRRSRRRGRRRSSLMVLNRKG